MARNNRHVAHCDLAQSRLQQLHVTEVVRIGSHQVFDLVDFHEDNLYVASQSVTITEHKQRNNNSKIARILNQNYQGPQLSVADSRIRFATFPSW